MDIEEELESFLSQGKQLKYDCSRAEAGSVGLRSLEDLSLGAIWITPETDEGYYEVPAVSLTGSCDAYDPEYLLLWLPNEKLYGAWDCDHWSLTVFPNTAWGDIAADPLKYLNAQWNPGTVGEKLALQGYPVKEGMPF